MNEKKTRFFLTLGSRPPGTLRPLVFDTAVLLANLLLVPPLYRLVSDSRGLHPVFALLMLAAFTAQIVGSWLKRRPLQARLMLTPDWGGGAILFFLVLAVMHLGLFMACLSLALEVLAPPPALELPVWLGLGWLPTFFCVAALVPTRRPVAVDPARLRRREFLADACLYLSTILVFVWWEAVFVADLAGAGRKNLLLGLLLVLLCTVPFAMFYLAPRLLLLAEDFRQRGTWLRLLPVTLPLAWRLVLG